MKRRKILALSLIFLIGWLIFVVGNVGSVEVTYQKISNHFPEPVKMVFMGLGLIGLSFIGRRKFRIDK
jgi:uncharacterized integral membrane protein